MIVLRRTLAVLLAAMLALAFGACVVTRTVDAALEPGFAKGALERVEAYDFVHDVLLPRAVEELLEEQRDWLSPNFEGVELPTDAVAQRVLLRLLRDVFPPEYLRQEAEQLIDQLAPYLAGRSDAFELRFALSGRVDAALGHAPGERSPVETAFRELNLGRVLIDGAFASFEQQALGAAEKAGVERSAAARELERLIPDRDEAAEWFTVQLFDAVDELRPYLVGEADAFRTRISFEQRAGLAEVLAEMLGSGPGALQRDGFIYTARDLERALGGEAAPASRDLDRQLDILRRDFVYTQADFLEDMASEGNASDVDNVRRASALYRDVLRWGGLAVSGLLTLLIGVLGGRRWATRAMWAAGALVVVSAGWSVGFGPLYGRFAEPEIHQRMLDATAGWPETLDAARLQFVDKVDTVIDDFAGGFAFRARLWLAVSALALAGSTFWAYGPRPGTAPPGDGPAAPAEPQRG